MLCPEYCCVVQGNADVLGALAERLETTAMAETLVRLVGADEQTAAFLPQQQLAWLPATSILPQLLEKWASALTLT